MASQQLAMNLRENVQAVINRCVIVCGRVPRTGRYRWETLSDDGNRGHRRGAGTHYGRARSGGHHLIPGS